MFDWWAMSGTQLCQTIRGFTVESTRNRGNPAERYSYSFKNNLSDHDHVVPSSSPAFLLMHPRMRHLFEEGVLGRWVQVRGGDGVLNWMVKVSS
jgi:hypothetical protein